jgi:hypothetical protein
VPEDQWYNHHNQGSGQKSQSTDTPIRKGNEIDQEFTERATRLNDAANAMSEHGLPKK